MNDLWPVAGGIPALLIVVAIVWRLYAAKNRSPRSVLEDPAFIVKTLSDALDRRSRFDIRFESPELNERILRGPCIVVNTKTLRIDVNLRYSVPSWRGQKVQVFFNLAGSRATVFYSFFSVVSALPAQGGGFAVELAIPRQLRSEQRRAFVRLSPIRGMVGDLSFWVDGPAVDGKKKPDSMPKPDVGFDEIDLDNISAGGARLLLLGRSCLDLPVENESRVRLHTLLLGAENRSDLSLWLQGEVLMTREQPDGMVVSVRFLRWAQEGEETAAELSWFPVNSEGAVPPLAAWVMHKHLEIHRDRAGQ